jgi:hypothetical protein
MRSLMSLVEGLAVDHSELSAPDVVGTTDIALLGQMLNVSSPLIFHNAMRKVIMNHSENLNDFEILEIARAFINFVGMGTEEGIRVALRLGHITRAHTLDKDEEPAEDVPLDGTLAKELADELADDPIDPIEPEIELPSGESDLPRR